MENNSLSSAVVQAAAIFNSCTSCYQLVVRVKKKPLGISGPSRFRDPKVWFCTVNEVSSSSHLQNIVPVFSCRVATKCLCNYCYMGIICIKPCRNFCALFEVLFQIGTLKYKIEWNFVLKQSVHFPVSTLRFASSISMYVSLCRHRCPATNQHIVQRKKYFLSYKTLLQTSVGQ